MIQRRICKERYWHLKPNRYQMKCQTRKIFNLYGGLHGFDECKYSLENRVSLLCDWTEILYGCEVARNLRLQERVGEIAGRNLDVNIRSYQDEDVRHFRIASSVDSLVRQLSKEFSAFR